MELKPGYKATEAGVIPEDWDAGSLGRFWSVTDCKHVTANFIHDGVPVASIKEVQSRFVDLTNAKKTTQHFYSLLIDGGRKPQSGDLILSRNATVGEIAQVAEWHPPFAMGQDVCLLRKKSAGFSTDFIQAIFQSHIIANQLSNLMVGSTFKRANVEQIRNVGVPMPPPSEQSAIAEALGDVDALLSNLDALIAKQRDIKQAAMQQLLTGKTRLPGFGRAWEVKRLGDVLGVRHGKDQKSIASPNGQYPILATGGQIGWASKWLYNKPSVLIGRKGTIDRPQYMETPFWTVDTLFYTELKGENVAKFFYYRFCLIDWLQYNEASGVPSLNARTIENLEIACPSPEEQTSIAEVLSDMDAELATLEERREKTRALKKGMMQELLTGKTRLVG